MFYNLLNICEQYEDMSFMNNIVNNIEDMSFMNNLLKFQY